MNNTTTGYRPDIAVAYSCSTRDLKNAAADVSRAILLDTSAARRMAGIAAFLHDILDRTRASATGQPADPTPADATLLDIGYRLDDLLHGGSVIPDDWEVWPWSPELHACHPGGLITAHCPDVGDIAVLVPER